MLKAAAGGPKGPEQARKLLAMRLLRDPQMELGIAWAGFSFNQVPSGEAHGEAGVCPGHPCQGGGE